MNRTVTLDLPAELLDQADQVAQQSGRTLEAALAAWIARGVVAEDTTATFSTEGEYYIYTPQADAEASNVLRQALDDYRAQNKDKAEVFAVGAAHLVYTPYGDEAVAQALLAALAADSAIENGQEIGP